MAILISRSPVTRPGIVPRLSVRANYGSSFTLGLRDRDFSHVLSKSLKRWASGPASLYHRSAWDLAASRRCCSKYASTPGAGGSGAMGSQGRHMARRYFPANWAK
jgi:hypothetical protein